ncbi:MAG: hypothetical protein IIC82_06925, partial [Chloroflexi bacterium]|nr:hypothetical protein [Chloroflexota bacterium]
MPVIAILEFQGTRPRVNNARLLGYNEAVTADNCKLWGGNLRGWRKDTNIESVADNGLVRSEEYDNAAWLKDDIFAVTANSDLGVDGTTTADKVISSSISAQHRIKQSATLPVGRVSGSFHAKASGVTTTTILLFQNAATVGSWDIDLS